MTESVLDDAESSPPPAQSQVAIDENSIQFLEVRRTAAPRAPRPAPRDVLMCV